MSEPQQPNAPPITLNSGAQNVNMGQSIRNQASGRTLTPQSPLTSTSSGASPNQIYQNQTPVESSELLLPPSRINRFQQYQDSPDSSRRSSWASSAGTGNRDSRGYGPFASPFDDSRVPSRAASPDPMEPVNMHTISEKYNVTPSAGLLLFPADKEEDDDLHDPSTGVNDRECDIFTKRGIINIGGLALITLGLLMLFIGYPVLTFTRDAIKSSTSKCSNSLCLDVPAKDLLKNVRTGLIDSTTPDDVKTRKSSDGTEYKLVFSDEFNTDGRAFYENDDPYWQAVDIHYAATEDLEWYDPDAVTTNDGYLEIEMAAFKNHDLDYRSGMLQGWNHMCFKGGIMEASISLPGKGDVSGLWPGFWIMGNLGRPGYMATTDGMWPYSYHHGCDAGITANQSSEDGISYLPGMRLPACTCKGEDHPGRGYSRSAPEIDALEGSVSAITNGDVVGSASQSAQIAPFDIWYQPNYDFMAVYNPDYTTMNSYRGGPYQQAISGLTVLNNDWYDGNAYQTYGFEYEPGSDGMIEWNVGSMKTWRIESNALGPNGNIGQRTIPEEPMAFVINLGMSTSFANVQYDQLAALMPVKMRVDWIRVWQDPNCANCSVTCDPPNFETTEYIKNHPEPYANFNLTTWEDTGYDWPKNDFVDGC